MDKLVNNYASYIEAQIKYLKNKPAQKVRPLNPFVTISRETGAYGITISQGLCEYLNKKNKAKHCPWAVFNKPIIKNITMDQNLPETIRPYLDETTVSEIKNKMNEIFNPHSEEHPFIQKTANTILHLAELGNVVLVGCASNVITTKLPGGIHVRLISPFENRVEHIQEYYPMTEKQAREYIFTEEGNRKDYLKKYFEKDVEDPSLYNLVFNLDLLQPKEIIQIVGDIVRKRFHLS